MVQGAYCIPHQCRCQTWIFCLQFKYPNVCIACTTSNKKRGLAAHDFFYNHYSDSNEQVYCNVTVEFSENTMVHALVDRFFYLLYWDKVLSA